MTFVKKYKTLADVLANTTQVGECLEWAGKMHHKGYPACSAYGLFKSQALHREVFRLTTGQTPPVVMHICDNPKCINPKHLKGGTPEENMRDMDSKGRRAKGARNGNAKFSDVEIAKMREAKARGVPAQRICADFGVSKGYLWKLTVGQYRVTNASV
jgi:hypothetical protein